MNWYQRMRQERKASFALPAERGDARKEVNDVRQWTGTFHETAGPAVITAVRGVAERVSFNEGRADDRETVPSSREERPSHPLS
jgi:hypothetical protein